MFGSRLRNRPLVHKRQLNVFSITLIFIMLTRLSSMDNRRIINPGNNGPTAIFKKKKRHRLNLVVFSL